jgi:hypothetical protein
VSDTIDLSVGDDMRLYVHPREVGRDAEHNSATFHVKQPSFLDQYVCRAEVRTEAGTTYRLVDENGEFALTNDMTVRGPGRLQLVYSDGVDVLRKTSVAAFHVTESLNAVDESAPGFGDGLAQLQGRCFADADLVGMTLNFYNLSGQLVGTVTSPAGGIEEVPATNGAYARTRSGGVTAWTDFGTLRIAGLDSPPFAGSPTLTPTPPAGTSSPVLANTEFVARDFLPRVGGQMSGPLITAPGTGLTNPGLAIGDNATGFYRTGNVLAITISGSMVSQLFVDNWMMTVPMNMALQRVYNLGDAVAPQDALNQRSGDGRYLARSGGQLTGTLTTVPGTGINDVGLGIGDNNTGFYRVGTETGSDLGFLIAGYPLMTLHGTRDVSINGPLNMGGSRVANMADATTATDALNVRSGDGRYLAQVGGTLAGVLSFAVGQGIVFQPGNSVLYENTGALVLRQAAGDLGVFIEPSNGVTAGRRRILTTDNALAQSVVIDLPGNVTFTSATFANLMPIIFPIPRGGNSRIMVSVVLDCSLPGDSQICITGVRCSSAPATLRSGFLYQLNGVCSGFTVQFVFDVVGTSVGPFDVQCANLSVGPGGGAIYWTALAGSQAVVTDLGPR